MQRTASGEGTRHRRVSVRGQRSDGQPLSWLTTLPSPVVVTLPQAPRAITTGQPGSPITSGPDQAGRSGSRHRHPTRKLPQRSVRWRGPVSNGQQLAEPRRSVRSQNHLGIKVRRVNLVDELSAATARRHNLHRAAVLPSPDGHDLRDLVLTGSHHRRDGSVLGTESGTGGGVDTHPDVHVAGVSDESRRHIAEDSITDPVRMQHGRGRVDEAVVTLNDHARNLTTLSTWGDGISPRSLGTPVRLGRSVCDYEGSGGVSQRALVQARGLSSAASSNVGEVIGVGGSRAGGLAPMGFCGARLRLRSRVGGLACQTVGWRPPGWVLACVV